ncbi:MAG: ATP-binding protein [Thermodesulfobacteriota bacterium]
MWIPRLIESQLARAAQERPVVVLTGARQSGKTSLVRKLFGDRRYVPLDLPADAHTAELDPVSFLIQYPPPLVTDEVQYAPGLFRHLKRWVDERRQENGLFLLTGSQKFPLMKGVADSLAGRVGIFELEVLSHRELKQAPEEASLLRLVVRGGFPELYEKPELEASFFYRSYLATYIERDVRALLQVGSLRNFERFIRACALRSAQLLNKAELARDVGVSPSTADQWLSVLVASNQVSLLEPWFSSRTKSLVKSPKLYLNDSGLLCFLLGIRNEGDLLVSPLAGAVWETAVYAELRKQLAPAEGTGSLFFWRDRTGEVDFLLHRGGRFRLMEAKWTETPTFRDFQAMDAAAEKLGSPWVDERVVVARTDRSYPFAPGKRVQSVDAVLE